MKKLSFVLAMIIALSGVIGLFSAPAYAADVDYKYDYIVGEGGYATVAEALAAVATNEATAPGSTHGIKVTAAAVTETVFNNKLTAGADITIYSTNAKKPVITTGQDSDTDGGWLVLGEGTAITLDGIEIQNDGKVKGEVLTVPTGTVSCDITVNNVKATSVGRFIRGMNAGEYENCVLNWTISNSDITTGHAGVQLNNRAPKGGKKENVVLNLALVNTKLTTGAAPTNGGNAFVINARTSNIDIVNSEVYAATGSVFSYNPNNVAAAFDINVTAGSKLTSAKANVATGIQGVGEFNVDNSTLVCEANKTPLYFVHQKLVDLTINLTDSVVKTAKSNCIYISPSAKAAPDDDNLKSIVVNIAGTKMTGLGEGTTGMIYVRYNEGDTGTAVVNLYAGNDFSQPGELLRGAASLNIYGGTYTSTNLTDDGHGVIDTFDDPDTRDGENTEVNIYGGTVVVNGKGSCVVLGTSKITGVANIYGGTFVDNGETVNTAEDKTDENNDIPTGLGGVISFRAGLEWSDGTTDYKATKSLKVYGGTFYTKAANDFEAYRYANATEAYAALVAKGYFKDVAHAEANFGTDKTSIMLGEYNKVVDDVKVTDIDKTYNGEEYAIAAEVTPDLDGIDYNSDFFKVKGVQILKGTTPDSPSTVARVLFMVKADQIANYDNLAAWYSTKNEACMNLAGEIPAGQLTEFAVDNDAVNETAKTNKVYASVLAGDVKVAADAGYYFVPVTVNVSNDNFDTDIYLRLFAREDGGEGIAISDVVTLNIAKLFN